MAEAQLMLKELSELFSGQFLTLADMAGHSVSSIWLDSTASLRTYIATNRSGLGKV